MNIVEAVLRDTESWFILPGCHSPVESRQETSFSQVIAHQRFDPSAHVHLKHKQITKKTQKNSFFKKTPNYFKNISQTNVKQISENIFKAISLKTMSKTISKQSQKHLNHISKNILNKSQTHLKEIVGPPPRTSPTGSAPLGPPAPTGTARSHWTARRHREHRPRTRTARSHWDRPLPLDPPAPTGTAGPHRDRPRLTRTAPHNPARHHWDRPEPPAPATNKTSCARRTPSIASAHVFGEKMTSV